MPPRNGDLDVAIDNLMQASEDQLLEEIGARTLAIQSDPSVAGAFEPEFTTDVAEMGLDLGDIVAFGRRVFRRVQVQAFDLVCGTDPDDEKDRKDLLDALGVDAATAAKVLAPLLVAQLGLAPAVAAVVAVLIIKRFFVPVHQEFCAAWKGRLPQTA